MVHHRPDRGLLARGVLLLGIASLLAFAASASGQVPDLPLWPIADSKAIPLPPSKPIQPVAVLDGIRPVGGILQPPSALPAPKQAGGSPAPAAPIYTGPATPTIQLPAIPVPNDGKGAPISGVTPPAPLSPTAASPLPQVRLSVRPRYSGNFQVQYKPLEANLTAVVVTGGVNLQIITSGPKKSTVDIEADRLVIWTRSNAQQMFNKLRTAQEDDNGGHEFYLSGHVELRTRNNLGTEEVRADELYYDVRRGVAVARQADLTIWQGKFPQPIHVKMEEWIRESPEKSYAKSASIFSSLLPSEPGFTFDINDFTIEERKIEKRRLFGLMGAYDKDGKPVIDTQHIFTGNNSVVRIEGWPILYFPYLRGRVEDPLGPLDNFSVNYNQIFGFQLDTTWDMFDIFGLDRPGGQRWRLFLDYLSERGFAYGTHYQIADKSFLGMNAKLNGELKLYGLNDRGDDVLGGDRGNFAYSTPTTAVPIIHPSFRGWAFGKLNVQELPEGFSLLGQFSFISDRNFLEQYYLNTHLNDLDQDTYLNLKQQQDNWAWFLLGAVRTRDWVTQTEWLPRADGHLIGQTFLDDRLVYNVRTSAGYARLRPTDLVPFAYMPTDVRTDTARLDLWQDISLPFYLGPIKLAPYLAGDAAYYSSDVNGDDAGRLYGGAGLRARMPLSRQYPDIQSDLFNVNGIYHKITLTGNYFTAHSSTSLNSLPQLDRLNDDVTDQALRDIRPFQTTYNSVSGAFLTTSPLFNPQNYALRRLVDNRIDTIDSIDVFQMGIRQRWQTKRGFPGNQHVVDWMTLNLGASVFPRSNRDNFGNTFGILEYDWLWNFGDRAALTSSGWCEPISGGPRTFDVGMLFNRPDSTNFYIGYRQIDPLESKAVVAAVVYPFSGKYAMTASTVWDFGVNVNVYSLMLSRMGTDFLVGFGVNYNSTLSTFGLAFEILPNLGRRSGGRTGMLFPTMAPNEMSVVR